MVYCAENGIKVGTGTSSLVHELTVTQDQSCGKCLAGTTSGIVFVPSATEEELSY